MSEMNIGAHWLHRPRGGISPGKEAASGRQGPARPAALLKQLAQASETITEL
jgi:hypothetical protein